MREEKVQDFYCNILEATFLISTDVCVNVRAQKIWKFLFDKLSRFNKKGERLYYNLDMTIKN